MEAREDNPRYHIYYRVHAFLEHWGLINYGLTILNTHKPSRLILPHTNAHFFTLSETNTGLHPAEPLRSVHHISSGEHCVSFHSDDEHLESSVPGTTL